MNESMLTVEILKASLDIFYKYQPNIPVIIGYEYELIIPAIVTNMNDKITLRNLGWQHVHIPSMECSGWRYVLSLEERR